MQTGQGKATGGIRGAEVPTPSLEVSDPMTAATDGRLPADERDALRARRCAARAVLVHVAPAQARPSWIPSSQFHTDRLRIDSFRIDREDS